MGRPAPILFYLAERIRGPSGASARVQMEALAPTIGDGAQLSLRHGNDHLRCNHSRSSTCALKAECWGSAHHWLVRRRGGVVHFLVHAFLPVNGPV
jgi:hypothetical protein